MGVSGLLLKQIVVMFILMSFGFIFYKIKFISDQGSKDISKILLYLVIPVVIIKNFMIERTAENVEIFIHAAIISLISMLTAMIISYIFFGKRDGVANFSSSFSNAGFIGIPLVEATLGPKAVFYISMMIVLVNALQWTYGVWIITNDASYINPKKIITMPIIVAVFVGLLVFLLEIPIPSSITGIFGTISNLNTPLAMIVSGVYLAQSDLVKMLKKINVYKVSLIRLVIIPLVTLLVFRFLPFGSLDLKLAILIAAACPVGSNVAIFANMYNKDYVSAVEEVCMTTILCLITLPIVITMAINIL